MVCAWRRIGVCRFRFRRNANKGERRSGRAFAAAPTERTGYRSQGDFGQLHRDRVTEAEAALARAHPDKASTNRHAQWHPEIDWDIAKETARYGLLPSRLWPARLASRHRWDDATRLRQGFHAAGESEDPQLQVLARR